MFSKMTFTKKLVVVVSAILVIVVGIVVIADAFDDPDTVNGTSTEAYLNARYLFEQVSQIRLPESRVAVDELVAGVGAGCSGILHDAPLEPRIVNERHGESTTLRLSTRDLLLQEATASIEAALRRPRSMSTESFVHKVRPLRWSDHGVTNVVQSFANVEAARLRIETPNLCKDAKEWAASNFRKSPSGTTSPEPSVELVNQKLSDALMALGCAGSPENAILQLLSTYNHDTKGLKSSQVQELEAKLRSREYTIIGSAVSQVEHTLGLPHEANAPTVAARRRISRTKTSVSQECRPGKSHAGFSFPPSSRRSEKVVPPSVPLPSGTSGRVESG